MANDNKLILWDDFEESASTHKESFDRGYLVKRDEANVVLVEDHGSTNFYKLGKPDDNKKAFQVSIKDLRAWIKANGQAVEP
jgi:hypothetical protein